MLAEESRLCTQDYLDKQASIEKKNYLSGTHFQEDVERARRFIFDELPLLGETLFRKRLMYHLLNFTEDKDYAATLYEHIIEIAMKSS